MYVCMYVNTSDEETWLLRCNVDLQNVNHQNVDRQNVDRQIADCKIVDRQNVDRQNVNHQIADRQIVDCQNADRQIVNLKCRHHHPTPAWAPNLCQGLLRGCQIKSTLSLLNRHCDSRHFGSRHCNECSAETCQEYM
jgi:hypothetical protein